MVSRKLEFGDVKLPLGRSRNQQIGEPVSEHETSPIADVLPASTRSNDHHEEGPDNLAPAEDAASSPTGSPQRKKFVGEGIIALRGHRKQSSQTLFNVSLDEPLKERLERASFETKVKQTVIVRAAINAFLKKEGY